MSEPLVTVDHSVLSDVLFGLSALLGLIPPSCNLTVGELTDPFLEIFPSYLLPQLLLTLPSYYAVLASVHFYRNECYCRTCLKVRHKRT